MYRYTITIAVLVLLAGIANGIVDTLQFHYSTSFAKDWDASYWNPDKSWVQKWKQVNGELVKPLTPRYFGSSTFLVFTTDAWHLAKTSYHGFLRIAMVIILLRYAAVYNQLVLRRWQYWTAGVGLWLVLAGVQALGFHVFYTLL